MPTTPSGYYFADGSTPMSAEDVSAAEATSAQEVFNSLDARSTVVVADFTALAALSTANKLAGDLAFVVEGAVYMSWTGTVWRQVTTATFATTAARDTAYAKAGAAYRVVRAAAVDTSTDIEFRWNGSAFARADGFIIPTALSGCTVSATGLVTVTAATRFAFDIGSGWDQVEIASFDLFGAGAADPSIRLRSGATVLTTSYSSISTQFANAATPSTSAPSSSAWPMGRVGTGRGRYVGLIALGSAAANKQYEFNSFDSDNLQRSGAGRNTTTTAHTAVDVTSSTALTGTFSVRGLVPS